MSQLWSRTVNFLKSETVGSSREFSLPADDDEIRLHRAFEELNSVKMELHPAAMSEIRARAVLNVSHLATHEEINRMYRIKIAENHPDKLQNTSDEILRLANIKTQEINEAFQLLTQKSTFK